MDKAGCDHWWKTIPEPGYGWISVCESCGRRESAEHSDPCQFGMYRNHMPCVCGAEEEFEKHERLKMGAKSPEQYLAKIKSLLPHHHQDIGNHSGCPRCEIEHATTTEQKIAEMLRVPESQIRKLEIVDGKLYVHEKPESSRGVDCVMDDNRPTESPDNAGAVKADYRTCESCGTRWTGSIDRCPECKAGERKLKSFSVTCEVWVKPLFRKSRPKVLETSWCAESYEEMLRLIRVFYEGKRWKLLQWREL